MQRNTLVCIPAHSAVELELKNARKKVACVRDICRDMILRSGIEIGFSAGHRRDDTLVPSAQLPPGSVIVCRLDLSAEHFPAPPIDEKPERQEGDFVHSLAQQQRRVIGLWNSI